MYIAVIGDLQQSRKLQSRDDVQKRLKGLLREINQGYGQELASCFSVTLGDEFQGLLKKPEKLLEILFLIKFRLYPVKARFGVGFGDITTDIDPRQSIGADGPAYHAARNMINEVKRQEGGKKALKGDIRLGRSVPDECLDALSAGLALMHHLETGWTDKQRENISDSLLKGLNQSEIAQERGLYQSTIHRSLVSAGYYEFEGAFHDFQRLLNRQWRELS